MIYSHKPAGYLLHSSNELYYETNHNNNYYTNQYFTITRKKIDQERTIQRRERRRREEKDERSVRGRWSGRMNGIMHHPVLLAIPIDYRMIS